MRTPVFFGLATFGAGLRRTTDRAVALLATRADVFPTADLFVNFFDIDLVAAEFVFTVDLLAFLAM